jgi:hypothetical protein
MSFLTAMFVAYGLMFGLMNDKAKWLTDRLKALPLGRQGDGTTFFYRMFVCPYCTGFHAGWMSWLLVRLPEHVWVDPSSLEDRSLVFLVGVIGDLFAHAFAASAFCYALDTIIQWFERES